MIIIISIFIHNHHGHLVSLFSGSLLCSGFGVDLGTLLSSFKALFCCSGVVFVDAVADSDVSDEIRVVKTE